jgi:hypothetical protein
VVALTAHSIDVLSEKLVDVAIRMAVGFKVRNFKLKTTPSSFESVIGKALERVSKQLPRVVNGELHCGLCGKGPFSRKGLYLHLLRIHRYEVKSLIAEELQRAETLG